MSYSKCSFFILVISLLNLVWNGYVETLGASEKRNGEDINHDILAKYNNLSAGLYLLRKCCICHCLCISG